MSMGAEEYQIPWVVTQLVPAHAPRSWLAANSACPLAFGFLAFTYLDYSNYRINVFEVRGSILKVINGNISFTVIHFLKFEIFTSYFDDPL